MRHPDPAVTARLRALGTAPSTGAAAETAQHVGPEHAEEGVPAPAWAPPTSLSGYVRASIRARLPAPLQGGRWDPGHRGLVLTAVVGLLALLVAVGVVVRSRATPTTSPSPAVAAAVGPVPAGGSDPLAAGVAVLVDVEGKVRHPGLVTLPAGARIAQALAAAGGPLPGTDTTGLDLAQKVTDGQQLRVGEAPPSPGVPTTASAGSGVGTGGALVNLNTASAEQLDALPHIGPATAAKIIDWRTRHGAFSAVNQLEQVPGIGPSTYEDIAPLVTV